MLGGKGLGARVAGSQHRQGRREGGSGSRVRPGRQHPGLDRPGGHRHAVLGSGTGSRLGPTLSSGRRLPSRGRADAVCGCLGAPPPSIFFTPRPLSGFRSTITQRTLTANSLPVLELALEVPLASRLPLGSGEARGGERDAVLEVGSGGTGRGTIGIIAEPPPALLRPGVVPPARRMAGGGGSRAPVRLAPGSVPCRLVGDHGAAPPPRRGRSRHRGRARSRAVPPADLTPPPGGAAPAVSRHGSVRGARSETRAGSPPGRERRRNARDHSARSCAILPARERSTPGGKPAGRPGSYRGGATRH